MIELQQQVTLERHDSEGWGKHQIFESVWVAPHRIESITVIGLTRLRMISGDVIDVKQSPDEIFRLMFGDKCSIVSYRFLAKEQPRD